MVVHIIKIHVYEYTNVISKHHCHQVLECGGGIAVHLLHSVALECPIHHSKCRFIHITWLNTNLFICIGHVNLGAKLCSRDIKSDLVLVGKWGYILYCVVISLPTVNHGSEFPILLCNAQHWHGLGCGNWFPPTSCNILDLIKELRF